MRLTILDRIALAIIKEVKEGRLRPSLGLLAVGVLHWPVVATPQGGVVRGVVVDSAGRGIPYAVVTALASERSVQADENGRFRLQLDQSETCGIWARRLGFHSATINFDSCPDSAVRIVLARAPREESGPRCGTRSTAPCRAPDAPAFVSMSAGPTHSCALEGDGTAWCWGDGRKAALGDSSSVVRRYPRRVATGQRFAQIAAGGGFTCGLTTAGTVFCWGTSEAVPTWPEPAMRPTEVASSGAASRLTTGRRHACTLDDSGRASCWGWNVDGETGTGSSGITSSLIATPTPVVGDYRFVSISAGSNFTCGVSTIGRVLCWGNNVDGVLGDQADGHCGDVEPVPCSARPVEIETPEPAIQVSSGTSHACITSASQAVYCWGANDHGQLGHAGPAVRTPRRVTDNGTERFQVVQSGGIETCAISTTNTLYCWGADYRRTRTTALTAEEVQPRQVADGVRAVSLGQLHFCAITSDGSIRCWGDTILGALGVR